MSQPIIATTINTTINTTTIEISHLDKGDFALTMTEQGLTADSGRNGNQFSGRKVAGQTVAGRVDGWAWEAVSRLGTGVPVTRQRWTAAAGRESR